MGYFLLLSTAYVTVKTQMMFYIYDSTTFLELGVTTPLQIEFSKKKNGSDEFLVFCVVIFLCLFLF